MGKLNTAKLRTMTKPGVSGDGGGLYLQVRDANARAWVFRYTLLGKAHWMGLGAFPVVGLAEAREAALAARKLLHQGKDPLAERKASEAARRTEEQAAAVRSFKDAAETYMAAHRDGWKNPKHRQQWSNTLEAYVYPKIGAKPVAEIAVGDVMDVLEPIWRTVPETAARVRGRVESVLDSATALGWRAGDNPARWHGHLENLLQARSKVAAVEHHAALPWRDIGAFMAKAAKREGVAALALRLLIMTATRTSETLGARWSEFDLDTRVWTIPPARMKAGREHRVPLSDAVTELMVEAAKLRQDQQAVAFVFPGAKTGKPLSNMALLMLLRRMGRDDLTAHGFRSTFRDWCAEATNYPREIAEAALAHVLKDKTEAAYQRGDLLEKRRQLMSDWADFCNRAEPAAASVVAIRASQIGA